MAGEFPMITHRGDGAVRVRTFHSSCCGSWWTLVDARDWESVPPQLLARESFSEAEARINHAAMVERLDAWADAMMTPA